MKMDNQSKVQISKKEQLKVVQLNKEEPKTEQPSKREKSKIEKSKYEQHPKQSNQKIKDSEDEKKKIEQSKEDQKEENHKINNNILNKFEPKKEEIKITEENKINQNKINNNVLNKFEPKKSLKEEKPEKIDLNYSGQITKKISSIEENKKTTLQDQKLIPKKLELGIHENSNFFKQSMPSFPVNQNKGNMKTLIATLSSHMAGREKQSKEEKKEPQKEIKVVQTDKMKNMLKYMNENFGKVKENSSANIPVSEVIVQAPPVGNVPPPPLLGGNVPLHPSDNKELKVPTPKIGNIGVPSVPPIPILPGVTGKGSIPIPPPIPPVVKATPYKVVQKKIEKKEVKKINSLEPKKPDLKELIMNVQLKKIGK